ncbi:MAG: metal ABC transporter substrate-binding protein [Rhizobiales bacterium]|jgi:zinc/manganese transport system substrate-binding protein|nr:metal ABC transporter substrate-binding protein [Hyphomicrobiales bacterium]
MRKLLFAALAAAALALPAQAQDKAQEKIKVLASFSILGDLVREVGGERVEVSTLVGPNTDMHGFQPTPANAKAVAGAKLVVINGLGLEGWADRLVKAANYKGARLVASKGVKALSAETEGHGHNHKHTHSGRYDPHAWQEVANVKIYVANIRDALAGVDPENKEVYVRNAAAYLQKLDALEAEIKQLFAGLSEKERRVITSHDAFHYFGDAYGIEFLAAQAAGGDTQPSARDVARLIQQIRKQGVKAVFIENISNPRVIEQVAKETGAKIGGTLYSDALSEASGPAPTYLDMMRHNAKTIAAALR